MVKENIYVTPLLPSEGPWEGGDGAGSFRGWGKWKGEHRLVLE